MQILIIATEFLLRLASVIWMVLLPCGGMLWAVPRWLPPMWLTRHRSGLKRRWYRQGHRLARAHDHRFSVMEQRDICCATVQGVRHLRWKYLDPQALPPPQQAEFQPLDSLRQPRRE